MRLILFLLSLCLLISIEVFSQVNGNYNYSLGLKGFTIMQQPGVLNQNVQKYISNDISGGMIRFNDNQISYRLSGSFLNKAVTFDNNCMNCDPANGKIKDYAIKIGFEKNLNYAHLQPYFAFDMGYRYNRFAGMMNTVNNQKNISAVSTLEDTKSGFTFIPVMGLRINPTEMISVFVESNLEFYYAYVRQETIAQDVSASKAISKFNRGEFLLNPVAIGIQVHLGNKN
jgi:hypothetical protein